MLKVITPFIFVLFSLFLTVACNEENSSGTGAAQGRLDLTLKYVFAVNKQGQAEPAKDEQCKSKFGNYVGKSIMSEYQVDPVKNDIYVTDQIDKEIFTLVSLGLPNEHVAAVFKPSNLRGAYSILFALQRDYSNPRSYILMESAGFNCLLSSTDNPFTGNSKKMFMVR